MPRSGWTALLSAALLVGGYALGVFTGDWVKRPSRAAEGGQVAGKAPRRAVFALGKLQPAGGVVPVIGPPGDRVERLCVSAGQRVKAGDVLLELASYADRTDEIQVAQKQFEEARTQLAAIGRSRAAKLAEIKQQQTALEATRQADLKAQKLKVAFLRKQKAAAEHRQERLAGLDESVVTVSAQEKEQAALAVAQASSELEAAEEGLEASNRKYQLQMESARATEQAAVAEFDLAQARVPIGSLEQNLKLARARHERARLKAPVDGTVIGVPANPGDPTGTGPLVQLAAGKGMVAVAEVYATDIDVLLGWVGKGRPVPAKVSGAALGAELPGRLADPRAIGQLVAANRVASFNPRADSDRRVVEVRVELDESTWAKAEQFIGLEVDVEFLPPAAAGPP